METLIPQAFPALSLTKFSGLEKKNAIKDRRQLTDRIKDMKRRKEDRAVTRLNALQEISVELLSSRGLHDTLSLIINKAVDLFICDGGSVYLKKDDQFLVFEVAVSRSCEFQFEKHTLPASDQGLAAYSYRTSNPLQIPDVYKIPSSAPFQFNSSFDNKIGYRTRSVLIQPLKSSKGEALGVLQLVNKKDISGQLWPSDDKEQLKKMPDFDHDDARLFQSFGAVASAAIENAKLHKEIGDLFEGFVRASVHAIEARDPITRGHSERVAGLSVELAKQVSESKLPALKTIKFSRDQINELEYAALLHDFGKIGVPEATLQKEEKLSPLQKHILQARIQNSVQIQEIRMLRSLVHKITQENRVPSQFEIAQMERDLKDMKSRNEGIWSLLQALNKPSVTPESHKEAMEAIKVFEIFTAESSNNPLVNADDIRSLQVLRGSLTPEERTAIESHVTHTYEFLKKIPWTKNLSSIPEIAFAHHEKIDGTGYPRKLLGTQIPAQSKIMTICDIFDALVASDRPYKAALPISKALDILHLEAKGHKLDINLLQVFIESKIFELPTIASLYNQSSSKKAA